MTHSERMNAVVKYLRWSSLFFNRFGGADHVIVCAWWNCREAFGPWHRMLLRRTVIGINERIHDWTRYLGGSTPYSVVQKQSFVEKKAETDPKRIGD